LKGELKCVRSGSGRPIVLIPGLQGDPDIFSGLFKVLSPGRPLWAFRLGSTGLLDDAATLKERLSDNGLKGLDVVAGSYGGHVALKSGGSFHSIVLTASFPKYEALPVQSRAMLKLSLRMPLVVLHRLYSLRFESRLKNDGVPDDIVAALRCPTGSEIMSRLRSLENLIVGESKAAVLWVAGHEDSGSPWTASVLQETWPGVSVQRISGKHRPYASHPEVFAAQVEMWWAEVQSSASKI
jgi:pimeloyl-ACP methyl ester carboxylesterase